MHGATLALANPGGFAKQLGHHASHVHPFCHTVAVSAMGRGHIVGICKIGTDADRDRFFPGIEMHEAWDLSLPKLGTDPGFKHPDELHALIDPEELVFGNIHTTLLFPIVVYRLHNTKRKGGKQKRGRGLGGEVLCWRTGVRCDECG